MCNFGINSTSSLLQFKQLSFQISDKLRCWVDENRVGIAALGMGSTCDMLTGYIICLDLSCSYFHGIIHPNNSLFQLYHLESLNLALNDFNSK
ncbi:hypothetical protein H5410_059275 [Solanum commersonii]|uniref:Uncharacterized protein n=1 Tax=Solanum commersonii TaxID=4109 RepID=A0A9J5W1Z1_SOLCO|nr:hypothetical protein H5410_059275 [Solanum commersonii]